MDRETPRIVLHSPRSGESRGNRDATALCDDRDVSGAATEISAPTAIGRDQRLKASLLALVSLALYLMTRTRHFSGDDTVFALVVQRFIELGVVEPVFLHPHHLVYNPLVALVSLAVRAFTGSVFVLDAGAAVSGAAAALAVSALYLVMLRRGLDDRSALFAAAALMVCGGFWQYATRMEVYTLAGLGVVIWLHAVSDPEARWWVLAIGLAAPWLGHSVLALMVVPAVLLHRRRPRVVAAALVAGVLLPGAVSLVLLGWLRRVSSLEELVGVVVSPVSAHYLSLPDPVAAVSAVTGIVVWRLYRALPVYPGWWEWSLDGFGWLALVVLALIAGLGCVIALRKRMGLGVAALSGIASLVPLWLVWDVGNTEHVVAAAPLFATLAGVGVDSAGRRWFSLLALPAVFSLLVANGVGSALLGTQPHLSRTLQVAYHIRDRLPDEATVVSVGVDHEYRLALPYLCGRRVISLTSMVRAAELSGAPPDEALLRWLEAAASARDPWFLEEFGEPSAEEWVVGLGVPRQAWRRALAHFTPGRAEVLRPDGIAVREPVTLRRVEVAMPRLEEAARPSDP